MLTSTLVALAALTAIAPAAAAPVSPYARRGSSDESGAITLPHCYAIARSTGSYSCPTETIGRPFGILGGPQIYGPQIYARRGGSGS